MNSFIERVPLKELQPWLTTTDLDYAILRLKKIEVPPKGKCWPTDVWCKNVYSKDWLKSWVGGKFSDGSIYNDYEFATRDSKVVLFEDE